MHNPHSNRLREIPELQGRHHVARNVYESLNDVMENRGIGMD
jgi:hypothetical protein